MNTREILERIMTAHWDMAACYCWVCDAARKVGCRPRGKYHEDVRKYRVRHDAFGDQDAKRPTDGETG